MHQFNFSSESRVKVQKWWLPKLTRKLRRPLNSQSASRIIKQFPHRKFLANRFLRRGGGGINRSELLFNSLGSRVLCLGDRLAPVSRAPSRDFPKATLNDLNPLTPRHRGAPFPWKIQARKSAEKNFAEYFIFPQISIM